MPCWKLASKYWWSINQISIWKINPITFEQECRCFCADLLTRPQHPPCKSRCSRKSSQLSDIISGWKQAVEWLKCRYPEMWSRVILTPSFYYVNISNHIFIFLWFVLYTSGPFYWHGLPLIPVWICNYIHYKVWDEITHPFLNLNGATVEVWDWISNFITPHFSRYVITYPCWC